jgi:5-methylthioadenosine/S-adenosylhomocysteine deaminase
VLKYDHQLRGINLDRAKKAVASTVEYTYSHMGESAWQEVMNPEQTKVELLANPYTYTRHGAGVEPQ